MENRIEYVHACELAIFSYLKTEDLPEFIKALRKIERHAKRHLKEGKDKILWFKFYKFDTIATDIRDIERGLSPMLTSRDNINFLKEQLKEVVKLDGELQVFYS